MLFTDDGKETQLDGFAVRKRQIRQKNHSKYAMNGAGSCRPSMAMLQQLYFCCNLACPSRTAFPLHRGTHPSFTRPRVCLLVRAMQGDSDDRRPPELSTPDVADLACYGTGVEVECVLIEDATKDSVQTKGNGNLQPPRGEPEGIGAALLDMALLVSPFFFWGTSMVAMKQLAPHTTPLLVATWRLIPAGAVLLAWAAATGRKQPSSPMAWIAILLFGLADGTCFQGFLAEGLQRTSAGLGSVIIDSQPLSVAVLASVLFGERLGKWGGIGLILGVAGLLLLEVPPSVLQTVLNDDLPQDALKASVSDPTLLAGPGWSLWDSGEWWMLLAAQSMAVGTVMVRWVAKYCDPVVATGWHMVLGGIPLAVLTVGSEAGTLASRLSLLTFEDAGLLIYVSLLGSAASYGVFFYEATVRGNLTALSSLTFLTPMFAAAAGYFVLGETLTPVQLGGAAVTLGAVALINSGSNDAEENHSTSKRTEADE